MSFLNAWLNKGKTKIVLKIIKYGIFDSKNKCKTYFFPLPWYDRKKKNAREAHLKRQMLMFEKWSKSKWHERKNSLQNKVTHARKFRGMVIAEKKKKKGGIEQH